MKIYLHEITDQDTCLTFTQDEPWVAAAVEKVDERLNDEPAAIAPAHATPRQARADFTLRKVDDVVVVSGEVETQIQLFCSRCANPFRFPCHPEFSALFCQDPVMAGVAHLEAQGKPAGQIKGFARHAHDATQDSLVDAGKDLDITYLAQDFIDLSEVITEQLQLQIPFQPLCREACKGMCTQCGADLNAGRCACSKLTQASPFAVLQSLKIAAGQQRRS
jgi:uncharacterized protein